MEKYHFRSRGFTVIELLIVLAVTSILLAIAIPGFQNVIRSSLLASGANDFAASLSLARTKAVMARRNARLCPSTNGTSCTGSGATWTGGWLMFLDNDGNGVPSTNELVQVRGPMDSRISLTVPSAFTQWIQFRPTGTVIGNNGAGGQFNFCSGDFHDYSRLVNISVSGRVTTRKQADLCGISTPSS